MKFNKKKTNFVLSSVGTNAKFLPGVYYEQRWEQNIEEFRTEMRIPDIPKLQ